ncbi:hypothetical protein OCU04_010385 [Sclerotinia nivalis]|uniref:C2H2-type domain-containing protein n=1 Tax=Sclerotinia nivalis TaxID=352851 RepID=A0A9X0DH10_9HELO|nr:hypothetical protein OCU04_010385 [Sclerotinia nivalis]
MDSVYDDCDWSVGNDILWLRQPQYATQYPITPHTEHDLPNSWAEFKLIRDDYLWGNCSDIVDINNLSPGCVDSLLENDCSTFNYSDTFYPIPDVGEEKSIPVTDMSLSDHTFNFEPLFEPWTEEVQPIFAPVQSSKLKCHYNSYTAEDKIESQSADPTSHQRREHARVLLDSFSGPNRCPWTGCTSRAKFANSKFLNIHLNNIHVEPLICGVIGCGYQKPFRNKHDLERHRRTAHMSIKEFACPYPSCSEEGLGFARKDKLLVHFRDAHGGSSGNVCPILHCGGILSGDGRGEEEEGKESMAEHMKRDHGNFECALGSCDHKYGKQKTKSLFSDQGLEKHLKKEHGINGSEALRIVSVARKIKEKTVRLNNVGNGCMWQNCKTCGS